MECKYEKLTVTETLNTISDFLMQINWRATLQHIRVDELKTSEKLKKI